MDSTYFDYYNENIQQSTQRTSVIKAPWYFFDGIPVIDTIEHSKLIINKINYVFSNFTEIAYWYMKVPTNQEFILMGRWGFICFEQLITHSNITDLAISYLNPKTVKILAMDGNKLSIRFENFKNYKQSVYQTKQKILFINLLQFKNRLENSQD